MKTNLTHGSNGWGYVIKATLKSGARIHVDALTARKAWDKYVGALIGAFYLRLA